MTVASMNVEDDFVAPLLNGTRGLLRLFVGACVVIKPQLN